MLTIWTTTSFIDIIQKDINSIERLDELVEVADSKSTKKAQGKWITVEDNKIVLPLNWNDTEPPYIFPGINYTTGNLLALVFYKIGNHQKSFEFISNKDELFTHLLLATHLQFGYEISNDNLVLLEKTSIHNLAVVYAYGNLTIDIEKQHIQNAFEYALKSSALDSTKLFTVKHYANFLMDNHLHKDAEMLIRSIKNKAISDEEINAINELLATSMTAQVSVPYDKVKLDEILSLQIHCIEFYENHELKIKAGLVLLDASEIANFQGDYVQSKELINKAILYFKEENIDGLLGEAAFRKATLLYAWSKNGNPQYYKPAINAFQDTLKIFKRDTHPQKFADIHHNLALIYSEIQVSEEEKAIWAAFCASSFKEVLAFYKKEKFPYEFAMACHNYATALMSFPQAKLHSNLDKAFGLFEDALQIRAKSKYPFERGLTLLNQLELYWMLYGDSLGLETIKKMHEKASEIKHLVSEPELLEKAQKHLNEIEKLKTIIAN